MQAYINWKYSVNALLVGAIRVCLPPILDRADYSGREV
jgi:hypothetical protein